MINIYFKYLLLSAALTVVGLLLPQAAFIKLAIVMLLAIVIKTVFFEYVDFYQVYKKARETATGAGMLFIGISLIISALISSGV